MTRYDGRELAAIFAGGAVGAVARVALADTIANGPWPWATFAANVAGAFLLGYFATRLQERLPVSTYRRPLLGTGFCGAFTTFSTMQIELLKQFDLGHVWLALGYATASIGAGFVAFGAAAALVRRVRIVA